MTSVKHLFDWLKLHAFTLTILLIVLVGVILRLSDFLQMRALWLDEAMLAINITQRSFWQLTLPLDYHQSAPPLFLLLEKAFILLLGDKDYKLRLAPFLAGMAGFPLLWLAGRRFLRRVGLVVLFCLLTFSTGHIRYTSEVKQYSSDVAITLLLLWLGQKAIDEPTRQRNYLILGLVGMVSLGFSHTTLLVLPGLLAALLWKNVRTCGINVKTWPRTQVTGLLVVSVLVAGGLALIYLINLRYIAANTFLFEYWDTRFMPHSSLSAAVSWIVAVMIQLMTYPLNLPVGLGLALLVIGTLALARKDYLRLVVLAAPLVMLFVAGGLHAYPVSERLSLFLISPIYIIIAAGFETCDQFLTRLRLPIRAILSVALALLLLSAPAMSAYEGWLEPTSGQDIKPFLKKLDESYRPGDRLYVSYWLQPSFDYYRTWYPFPGLEIFKFEFYQGSQLQQSPARFLQELDQYQGQPRLWLLFASIQATTPTAPNEEDLIIPYLEARGALLSKEKGRIAALYLFDLSGWK